MIIYVTTRDGSIFTVDKKAAEAIVYNTAAWVPAVHNTAPALLRAWDICAVQAGDDEARGVLAKMSADYTFDNGYPFIERA